MKNSRVTFALVAALLSLIAWPVAASTVTWSQQWDTTPVNPPATIDMFIIYADTNTSLLFGDALTDFVPYYSSANVSGWTSTLINPYEVVASGPAVSAQDFAYNINFGSPHSASGYLLFEYFNGGQMVSGVPNPQQWHFDGSWSQQSTDNFGAVPEPVTAGLIGLGLVGLGVANRKRRT